MLQINQTQLCFRDTTIDQILNIEIENIEDKHRLGLFYCRAGADLDWVYFIAWQVQI